MSDITAAELLALTEKTRGDASIPPADLAEEWLYWFQKRGERFLTTAAKFGYTEVTLDLPLALARTMNKPVFKHIMLELKKLVPGSTPSIVEEEYEGEILFKVEISWRPKPTPAFLPPKQECPELLPTPEVLHQPELQFPHELHPRT
jgi:hypothetical protein